MSKRRILLVDDDNSLLVTLSDFLLSEGYDVVTADSGERALKLLPRNKPDLIVLDMSMPGIGGMGVLEALTRSDGRLRFPVLVLTARAAMAEYFANKQVDGFLAKPCDPADLALEISRILFQGAPAGAVADAAAGTVPRVLLGEPDGDLAARLRGALADAGFEVEVRPTAPEVLERAVLNRPEVVAVRMGLAGLPAVLLVQTLWRMPSTRNVPVVVYGIDQPGVPVDQVAAIDETMARFVSGLAPAAIVAVVRDVARRVKPEP